MAAWCSPSCILHRHARVQQVLAAFDALSGRTVWSWSSGSCTVAHWSADDQILVVVLDTPDRKGQLVALDRASGTPRWHLELTGEAAAAPVHAGETVHLATRCGRALAWNAQSGQPLWDIQVARRISTAPLVADDAVYIAAFDPGRLVVLEPLSGGELWRKSAGGAFTTTPFIAGERIWASDRTGVLHAWDPRTHRTTAQLPAWWSGENRGQPAVEDRTMFVSTSSGLAASLGTAVKTRPPLPNEGIDATVGSVPVVLTAPTGPVSGIRRSNARHRSPLSRGSSRSPRQHPPIPTVVAEQLMGLDLSVAGSGRRLLPPGRRDVSRSVPCREQGAVTASRSGSSRRLAKAGGVRRSCRE
ncbi:PQQ-binding-like beta-propeller repeat protein [Streptomyces yokosukanensis]|uniref:PQQ-binding-like beta-propeller repeat protein n=1 Tax=Streptomyces yokosukanensis TaxID=67386 RepID=UPI00342D9FDF